MPDGDLIPIPGYLACRRLPDGRVIGILPLIYTTGLCVDLTEHDYAYRYCYPNIREALTAYMAWNGQGDPPGPWIKLKGHPERREARGPGWAAFMKEKAPR